MKREESARMQAEAILEAKSRELYLANSNLHEEKAKVAKQNSELDAILTNTADAIVTVNEQGFIQSFNAAAERIFGIAPKTALKLKFESLFSDLKDLEAFDISASAEFNRELTGIRGDGSEFVAELSTSSIGQLDNKITIATLRDRTRRKLLESQLARAQKMESIGTLSAGIAHELNTPVQFVGDNIKFVQLALDDIAKLLELHDQLLQRLATNEPVEEAIARIEEEREYLELGKLLQDSSEALGQSLQGTERMTDIVAALKDFSHPGEESKVPLDVNELIDEALVIAKHEYKYAAVIQKDFQFPMPKCLGFRGDFLGSILNLVINAVHAIGDQLQQQVISEGKITIQTKSCPGWIEVMVADNGCGIPQAIIDKIFDPFFTTKPEGKGTGQGLAIVHSVVVEKHGGELFCNSTPGKGTEFTIRLPRYATN